MLFLISKLVLSLYIFICFVAQEAAKNLTSIQEIVVIIKEKNLKGVIILNMIETLIMKIVGEEERSIGLVQTDHP